MNTACLSPPGKPSTCARMAGALGTWRGTQPRFINSQKPWCSQQLQPCPRLHPGSPGQAPGQAPGPRGECNNTASSPAGPRLGPGSPLTLQLFPFHHFTPYQPGPGPFPLHCIELGWNLPHAPYRTHQPAMGIRAAGSLPGKAPKAGALVMETSPLRKWSSKQGLKIQSWVQSSCCLWARLVAGLAPDSSADRQGRARVTSRCSTPRAQTHRISSSKH